VLNAIDRQSVRGFDQFGLSDVLARLEQERFIARVWQRDPDVWKPGDADHAAVIKNRLGWLTVIELMEACVDDLAGFADGVRQDGIKHVVLMGMGGSSLCPIVLRDTFGVRAGYPELVVLDSTSPAAVLDVESKIDVSKSLFIDASKSGSTLESHSFAEYFLAKATAKMGSAAAAVRNFACITDPGTKLEALARERGYRRIFSNPADIGGRYSALSFFGLVPGAVAGVDVAVLLERASRMAQACAAGVKTDRHPATVLGAALAQAAFRGGRDKVTFLASPQISTIGMWLEQLIAESTGKEGKGLIPVSDEPPGSAGAYGDDRVFVSLKCGDDSAHEALCRSLEDAGHPIARIHMRDALDVAEEFFRWEFATATAGALLGIDPFDEPNVKESKDNTNRILAQGVKPDDTSVRPDDRAAIAGHLASVRRGDYIALQAFIHDTPARTKTLQRARKALRDATRAATTLGYGPRFLHSTGQLHKGGPNSGVFVQFVGREGSGPAIPGEAFDFGTLIAAQGLGDLKSLRDHGRRVISIDLGDDIDGGLAAFARTIDDIAGHLAPPS
jgi:transaldolase/glucose-6-phosphate isomerase